MDIFHLILLARLSPFDRGCWARWDGLLRPDLPAEAAGWDEADRMEAETGMSEALS